MTDLDALVENCPYDTKLAVTAWVFKHIAEHGRDPGSFRYLIYERLGFGLDAYVPLYEAGGMDISNDFDTPNMDAIREKVREEKIESLKPLVGLCDEPGCFKGAGCGWSSESGYRWTCHEHWRGLKNENDL